MLLLTAAAHVALPSTSPTTLTTASLGVLPSLATAPIAPPTAAPLATATVAAAPSPPPPSPFTALPQPALSRLPPLAHRPRRYPPRRRNRRR